MTVQATGSFSLRVSNGGSMEVGTSGELTHTAAGTDMAGQQQTATTSWAALDIGNCSVAELLAVKNTDPTNYVQLATANDGSKIFAKLAPGRGALFPPDPSVTVYVKANAASCVVEVVAIEP